MAYIDTLVDKVDDPKLQDALHGEIRRLRGNREFGLIFERHLPEFVRLLSHPVKRGVKVQERATQRAPTWTVTRVVDGTAHLVDVDGAALSRPVDDLVVVREFGEPVFPGLRRVGRLDHGGDKPFHAVVNAENYHALEMLTYLYEGQVGCIYIDPPYNTGARDWKYNNDYVDSADYYRHSKWLSFMERRLRLAKRLLNPAHSVLVITIDEHEVHHLGVLLEDLFPEATRQLVTIVVNPLGQARRQELGRVEEYAFFVFLGSAEPEPVHDDMLNSLVVRSTQQPRWERLLRGGTNADRADRPGMFYPVFIDPEQRRIMSVGDALPLDASPDQVSVPTGLVAVWPLRTTGEEGRWRCAPNTLRSLVSRGYARVGAYDATNNRWSLLYLGSSMIRRIESGDVLVTRKDEAGAVVVEYAADAQATSAKTVWNRPSHRAGEYGTRLLSNLIGERRFTFPKSLYAVQDTLRIACGGKKDALVVDFFAGSGTTLHAVAMLNEEDGGRRRCIIVTNNEVSADTASRLAGQGYMPGDFEFEKHGIFWSVTKPRCEACITGNREDGPLFLGST